MQNENANDAHLGKAAAGHKETVPNLKLSNLVDPAEQKQVLNDAVKDAYITGMIASDRSMGGVEERALGDISS